MSKFIFLLLKALIECGYVVIVAIIYYCVVNEAFKLKELN